MICKLNTKKKCIGFNKIDKMQSILKTKLIEKEKQHSTLEKK